VRRSQRRLSGTIAALLGAALLVASCQDGYPIAATRCDRWCHVRQATGCGNYNPAECVGYCEQSFGDPACRDELDAVLACEEKPGLQSVCEGTIYSTFPACSEPYDRLFECARSHSNQGPTPPE
jgi:hypothetical protein